MNSNSVKTAGQQKKVFTEPTCKLVEFSFENILMQNSSGGNVYGPSELPPDIFD